MIRSLKIQNCLSFLDETQLNFLVTNKAPATAKYERSAVEGERISKILGIVGANASGKSNLLRTITFLKWLLLDSFGTKPDQNLPMAPFMFKDSPLEPSQIEVEFESMMIVYRYHVTFSQKVILSETLDMLRLNDAEMERKRFRQLFSRTFDSDKSEYSIKAHTDFALSEGIREISKKRFNASLISAALFSNHDQSLPIKSYWSKVTAKIKQYSGQNVPLEYLVLKSSEFYYKNPSYKSSMEEIMSKCDLGLVGLHIGKVTVTKPDSSSEEQVVYAPYGRHTGLDGKEYRLPMHRESSGTQQIYVLLSTLLPVLEDGGIAVIDELEADLHPELLPALIDLFISKKTNKNGAQLVFTCHATPLLNILDKYQVVIVEKGSEGTSEAWRLDEIEGVRNDDNFFAKYTAGAYGGVPRPGKLSDGTK